eukprot:TRINITY_DN1158_c2_g1_i4.p1 TRINITY_DN1158_c2_g1~~TRINITY_DN1158_c2_g1_i4.p1  ORF type:complete len:546 (+),score=116.77 TRINITY_DN1158_c2_g1_i4:41-1678(+)
MMESIEMMTPAPRYFRGVKDLAFKRAHVRLVKEHDQQYIERHDLTRIIDEAWEKCLTQKPTNPLSFLANQLDPHTQRDIVLKLQDQIADLKAEKRSDPFLEGCIISMNDNDIERVQASFASVMCEVALEEMFYSEVSERSADISDRLQKFDEKVTTGPNADPTQRFLPLLRLVTDHLKNPSVVEGYVRGVARRHIKEGIIERDYHVICNAFLSIIRRHLFAESKHRDSEVKKAWVKLHGLISITMAAGGQMRDLHVKHQTSLMPTEEELKLIRMSLNRVTDRASAAAAIVRGVLDLSPEIAEIIETKKITPTAMGEKLLDGVDLVIELLGTRGSKPAIDYLHVLGQRHLHYGVNESLYPIVGQALLSAIHHSLAKDTERRVDVILSAWRKALDILIGMAKNPLMEGASQPTAATMVLSDLRSETKIANLQLEADLAAVASGRATPDLSGETHEISHLLGDVSNVPVSTKQLKDLFDNYDVDNAEWISKEMMVDILASQEEFGVPISREKISLQIDDIIKKHKLNHQSGKINFHLFSVVMLKISQR